MENTPNVIPNVHLNIPNVQTVQMNGWNIFDSIPNIDKKNVHKSNSQIFDSIALVERLILKFAYNLVYSYV